MASCVDGVLYNVRPMRHEELMRVLDFYNSELSELLKDSDLN